MVARKEHIRPERSFDARALLPANPSENQIAQNRQGYSAIFAATFALCAAAPVIIRVRNTPIDATRDATKKLPREDECDSDHSDTQTANRGSQDSGARSKMNRSPGSLRPHGVLRLNAEDPSCQARPVWLSLHRPL